MTIVVISNYNRSWSMTMNPAKLMVYKNQLMNIKIF